MMSMTLEIASGPCRGQKCVAEPGDTVTVGSSSECALKVEGDAELASTHFVIVADHDGVYLFARVPVKINEQTISVASLMPNQRILAGNTRFLMLLGPESAKQTDREWLSPSLRALARLGNVGRLFAVVDGARDERIAGLLESGIRCESLYEGDWKAQVATAGPYLADLNVDRNLLTRLIFEGWGRKWAVFVAANTNFATLRLHLRRYLTVQTPDGHPVYFRFYDPGVLSTFLPACTPAELTAFFGPIQSWISENDSTPQLMHEFEVVDRRLQRRTELLFDVEKA